MVQLITVVDHDPKWVLKFNDEKQKIDAILKSDCFAVYHIGSTSVENLSAKPIIDILAVVRDLSLVDAKKSAFEEIGYEYLGEFGIKGRRYLRKGGDERTHQIHIFKYDNLDEIIRHLAFRDYLRANKDICAEYAKLKKALAVKFPYDIDGYCEGKDSFVKEYEQKALACYDSSWDRLYFAAKNIQTRREVSPFITAGPVSSALMTADGNIYTGICIDMVCSLGMCAERNAISTMITNGENKISKILALSSDGSIIMACGSCREFLMQLSKDSPAIEVLTDYERKIAVPLGTLLPNWWGTDQFS
ncbi:GrpB family protein [Succinatimonas hippei]|uniref:GrpB family protein n=1 Tax=Succinatimonas hippei TaxID=626938 RepID=UPI0026F19CB6|nr:GrpB family protein [Succinatimonas hippei]